MYPGGPRERHGGGTDRIGQAPRRGRVRGRVVGSAGRVPGSLTGAGPGQRARLHEYVGKGRRPRVRAFHIRPHPSATTVGSSVGRPVSGPVQVVFRMLARAGFASMATSMTRRDALPVGLCWSRRCPPAVKCADSVRRSCRPALSAQDRAAPAAQGIDQREKPVPVSVPTSGVRYER